MALLVSVSLGTAVGGLIELYDALVIWVAPRIYLLEYFTDLLQKVTK